MKKNFSTIVSVITCVLFVFCVLKINSLQREVDTLNRQLDMNYNNLYTEIINSRSDIVNQVTEQLDKQDRIFDSVKTSLQYHDNKVALTITAVPKELKNGESIWASVEANGQAVQQKFDSNNQAVLYFEPVYSVVPKLQIKSNNGVRQQVLDEVVIVRTMSTRILGNWNHEIRNKIENNDWSLIVADIIIEPSQYFNKDTGLIPFSIEDVVDAYCIVQQTDEVGMRGEGYIAGPVALPNGERLNVSFVSADGAKEIVYRADFSKYQELKEDVRYAVHFVMTLSNGLTYCTEGSSILEFCYGNTNRPFSGGCADFVPVFGER